MTQMRYSPCAEGVYMAHGNRSLSCTYGQKTVVVLLQTCFSVICIAYTYSEASLTRLMHCWTGEKILGLQAAFQVKVTHNLG